MNNEILICEDCGHKFEAGSNLKCPECGSLLIEPVEKPDSPTIAPKEDE